MSHSLSLPQGCGEKSQFMNNITDELLTEILIRLPKGKEAAGCGVVCKRWYSLISQSHFTRSFIDHRRGRYHSDSDFATPLALLLLKHLSRPRDFPTTHSEYYQISLDETLFTTNNNLNFLPWNDVVIRACCDDLLLVSRENTDCAGNFSLCICNPMTRKWCALPEPPQGISKLIKCGLVYHRHSQGRYTYYVKLMFFVTRNRLAREDAVWTSVFSSDNWLWSPHAMLPLKLRTVRLIPRTPRELYFLSEFVPCSDGLVYCLRGSSRTWRGVLAFGPLAAASADGQIECRPIDTPAEAGEWPKMHLARLGTYRGRLQAAILSNDNVLKVWELRWNDNVTCCSWSLVHIHNVVLGTEIEGEVRLLSLHVSDRNVIFLFVGTGHVFRYDLSCGRAEKVGELPGGVSHDVFLSSFTLCSPFSWPTPVPLIDAK